MKIKIKQIAMLPLFFSLAIIDAHAAGYTTSQNPGSGYTTSKSPTASSSGYDSGYSTGQSYNSSNTVSTTPGYSSGYSTGPSVQSSDTYANTHRHHKEKHSLFGFKFKFKNVDRYRDPYWNNMVSNRPIPPYAIDGGREPNAPYPLYICHGYYHNGVHPGKLLAGHCNITWDGREIRLSNYQILESRVPLHWIPASNGYIPPNAVTGGKEYNRPLYICQAFYNGGFHPGKIVGHYCNISYAGNEISIPDYKVLVR